MRWSRSLAIPILINLAALIPLALLAWDWAHDQLTADPIREVQLRTGRYALILLVLTLACSPIYNFTGFKPLLVVRRILGLYAFAYATLHLFNFIGLDYGFNFSLLWEDISEKRYILVGFLAFLILLALAITSSQGWRRRLGKAWVRLHAFIYLAAILGVIHYFWQLKIGFRGPLVVGVIIAVLLVLRLPPVAKLISRRPGQAID